MNFKSKNNLPIPTTKVKFYLPNIETGINRVIFAGEYPPCNASIYEQHDNLTSINIKKQLASSNFDFIDILPFSPITKSTDICRKHMFSLVTTNLNRDNLVNEFKSRINFMIIDN